MNLSFKTCSSTQGYIPFTILVRDIFVRGDPESLKSSAVVLFYRSETAATELRFLNSTGIIRSQGVKCQHLIANDKVDMVTVINSRVKQ